jgi:hypothetical protein
MATGHVFLRGPVESDPLQKQKNTSEAGVSVPEFSRLRSYRSAWAMQPGGPVRPYPAKPLAGKILGLELRLLVTDCLQ